MIRSTNVKFLRDDMIVENANQEAEIPKVMTELFHPKGGFKFAITIIFCNY